MPPTTSPAVSSARPCVVRSDGREPACRSHSYVPMARTFGHGAKTQRLMGELHDAKAPFGRAMSACPLPAADSPGLC